MTCIRVPTPRTRWQIGCHCADIEARDLAEDRTWVVPPGNPVSSHGSAGPQPLLRMTGSGTSVVYVQAMDVGETDESSILFLPAKRTGTALTTGRVFACAPWHPQTMPPRV
jgi:hypothetical protein